MEKKYHSIKEVSEMLNLPQSTLRFWEKEIDILEPNKSKGGTNERSTTMHYHRGISNRSV